MSKAKHTEVESKVLGQTISYPQEYAPEILVAIPRKWNREIYDIQDNNLPFVGVDAWHAYELSFLTKKGLPVNGLLKLVIPANSPSIVESKSLKLYLNSFNMSRYGQTKKEGVHRVLEQIKSDLDSLLECKIEVALFKTAPETQELFSAFDNLDSLPALEEMTFGQFNEDPALLKEEVNQTNASIQWKSEMLRSNCKVTNQPDWGTVFVEMKGDKLPEATAFIEYIVSMRNENHFHEEICEMIFKRLNDIFAPEELMVACVYTRRGGIDICPIRSTENYKRPEPFVKSDQLFTKCLRQ